MQQGKPGTGSAHSTASFLALNTHLAGGLLLAPALTPRMVSAEPFLRRGQHSCQLVLSHSIN